MNAIEQFLNLLGTIQRDVVTGRVGMVESLSFDAYGCVQAVLKPRAKEDGTVPDGFWCDAKRLQPADPDSYPAGELVDGVLRLIPVPTFVQLALEGKAQAGQEQGPADKPLPPHY